MQHTKFYSFTAHEKQHFTHQANNWFFTVSTFNSCGIGTILQEQILHAKTVQMKKKRNEKKMKKEKKKKKSSKKTLQAIFKLAKNSQRGNADLKQRPNNGHEEKFFTRAKR